MDKELRDAQERELKEGIMLLTDEECILVRRAFELISPLDDERADVALSLLENGMPLESLIMLLECEAIQRQEADRAKD